MAASIRLLSALDNFLGFFAPLFTVLIADSAPFGLSAVPNRRQKQLPIFLAVCHNMRHLLFQRILPSQQRIEVIYLVWPLFWPDKDNPDNIGRRLFQRLTVLLIDGQQEKGEHCHYHRHRRQTGAAFKPGFKAKIQRQADSRSAAEAHQLPQSQPKHYFTPHPAQIRRYAYISQLITFLFFIKEYRFT